jgi:hypothetical protein
MTTAAARVAGWWFAPAPLARLAVLRTLVYLYLPVDLFVRTGQVVAHTHGSPELYAPVTILRWLHQPAPQPWFAHALRVLIIVVSLVAATGRLRRLAGWTVAVAYADWTLLAMSYGKIGHDHLAILTAVLVLPTVAGASWRSTDRSASATWALRWVEITVVATYFLSAYAKVRFGGWHWVTGATFAWAVVRRGTGLADPLLQHPMVLLLAQWGLFLLEVATPVLLFVRQRWRTVGVVVLLGFHVTTWLMITINFLPQMVCLAVFLPLEALAAVAVRALAKIDPRRQGASVSGLSASGST